MFDFDALLSLSIVALGILGWAAFVRLVAGREPLDLAALFGHRPWELAWPRGVQEEEPAHWRTDLAQRPGRRAAIPAPAQPVGLARPQLDPCECAEGDAAA